MTLEQIQGNVTENRQVFRRIIEANTRSIFSEDNIECPMEAILD